jgi:hypothetical protein
MMARLKVRVTKVERRQGQAGAYAIAHLAGGKRAYVWDRALAEALATPGIYEVEAEERRGFLRITGARPIASTNGTQGHDAQGRDTHEPQEASRAPGSTQERLEALRLAVALAPRLGLRDVAQVLAVAERMLQWLQKGGR